MTKIPLTFTPVHKPQGHSTSHPRGIDNARKKIKPPVFNNPPALFWVLPLIRAPLPTQILQTIGTLSYNCIPRALCSSLFRFKIFLRQWTLVKLCPIIMRSTAHNVQTFVPTILTRLMVFEHQRMSTLMWVQHHSATSTFVSNWMCFMWVKRWRASADQFSCCALSWLVVVALA